MEIIQALPYIKSFVLVVEHESFAQAAAELALSRPAVSKQINKLEAILGMQLLVRTTRRMTVTELGERFYEQCKRILEEIEEAQGWVSETHKEPGGRLKVIAGRYFAKTCIVPLIGSFIASFPRISLDLELAERIPDLEKERADIVIGMSVSAEKDNIIQREIMATRYVFCASKKYLQDWGIPQQPRDLNHHRYITHSMRKPSDALWFHGQEPICLQPGLSVNDVETMLGLAIEGLGIIKVHEYMVKEAIEKGELVEVLKGFSTQRVPIFVAYLQRRIASSKIRCFIDYVLKNLPRKI